MYKKFLVAPLIALLALSSAPMAHASAGVGDLVMCEDFSTVYFLAEDGNRYSFPNESIYFSWYRDFDEVKLISCEALADLPLVGNVVYQAGTALVKLQSNPTVYAVESNGVLRAIGSEEQAEMLYGDDWAEFVDDLPDAFFSSFELGDNLAEGELPEGMILVDDTNNLLRVKDDGSAVEIDEALDSDDDEQLLSQVAQPLDEVESRVKIEISISSLSDLGSESILTLLELLQTVDVEVELEIDIDVQIEEEDELEHEDAEEEINDAIEEIARAEVKISERELDGKDVTEAQELLSDAKDLLSQAEDAYASGDYELAENLAEEAEDFAEDARMGSAVNSSDDGDEDDDNEVDEQDEDESDDQSEDSEEEDEGDNEDQDDTDDSDEDETEEEDDRSEQDQDDDSSSGSSDNSSEDSNDSDSDNSGSSDGESSGSGSDSSGSGGGDSSGSGSSDD